MADIYDLATGHTITAGLQGSAVCDEAILFARRYAASHNKTVIIDDDGDEYLVGPRGGKRKFTPSLKRRYGFDR